MSPQTPCSVNSKTKRQTIIRRAEEKDIFEIANLGAKTFAESFGYSMLPSDLQDYLETAYSYSAIKNDLADPLKDIFVANNDRDPNHVMGFVQLTRGTSEPCLRDFENIVELQRLYVAENYHGSGVGGSLVRHVEKLAKESGFATMWLGVWEENIKAQKVYERFGFKKAGEHDFKMGTCIQTDWILTKQL
jgi:ribosomal protein S18 acetylase RimI-like enzyme